MEALRGGFPTEDFAGSIVEHFLVDGELLIRDGGKVHAFGQAVADASVLAFASASFPWAERVAEENVQPEIGGEDLVLGHLFALVVGQAQAQGLGYLQEPAGECLPHARGVFLGASGKASYDGGCVPPARRPRIG